MASDWRVRDSCRRAKTAGGSAGATRRIDGGNWEALGEARQAEGVGVGVEVGQVKPQCHDDRRPKSAAGGEGGVGYFELPRRLHRPPERVIGDDEERAAPAVLHDAGEQASVSVAKTKVRM